MMRSLVCACRSRRSKLHATVGPGRTTITSVAERAGVDRLTVYRHFPTNSSACPIAARSRVYAANDGLLLNVLRDAETRS